MRDLTETTAMVRTLEKRLRIKRLEIRPTRVDWRGHFHPRGWYVVLSGKEWVTLHEVAHALKQQRMMKEHKRAEKDGLQLSADYQQRQYFRGVIAKRRREDRSDWHGPAFFAALMDCIEAWYGPSQAHRYPWTKEYECVQRMAYERGCC